VQLHKRDVLAKAVAILDSYGIADLTMRRLARELDVTPGALYWHFANKQELLGAVADELLAPACVAGDAPDWRNRIVVVSRRLRDALLSHTDGAELVSATLAAGQSHALTRVLDMLAAAAVDAGVSAEHAALSARTIVYYVLGFTADEQSRLQWDAAGAVLPEDRSLLRLPPEDEPRPIEPFDVGLQLMVDGLAVRAGGAPGADQVSAAVPKNSSSAPGA